MISSIILSSRLQINGLLKVKEEHVDENGDSHFVIYITESTADTAALLIIHAQELDISLESGEVLQSIRIYESGGGGLHTEISPGNFQKITPIFQTWDELAERVLKDFFSRLDQLELKHVEPVLLRPSTQDKKDLLGLTNPQVNSLNSDIQTAINTQDSLDIYQPWFDENGALLR